VLNKDSALEFTQGIGFIFCCIPYISRYGMRSLVISGGFKFIPKIKIQLEIRFI
jgi:hypothetical protein